MERWQTTIPCHFENTRQFAAARVFGHWLGGMHAVGLENAINGRVKTKIGNRNTIKITYSRLRPSNARAAHRTNAKCVNSQLADWQTRVSGKCLCTTPRVMCAGRECFLNPRASRRFLLHGPAQPGPIHRCAQHCHYLIAVAIFSVA